MLVRPVATPTAIAPLASAPAMSCVVSPMTTGWNLSPYFASARSRLRRTSVARTLSSVPYPPTSASKAPVSSNAATLAAATSGMLPVTSVCTIAGSSPRRPSTSRTPGISAPCSANRCRSRCTSWTYRAKNRSGVQSVTPCVVNTSAQMSRSVRPPKSGVARHDTPVISTNAVRQARAASPPPRSRV